MTKAHTSGGENEIIDMVYAATYDMKAPLTLIKGLNELIASGDISAEKKEEYIARISASVERMQRTIDIISSLNEIVEKQSHLPLEPVCIPEVAGDVTTRLSPLADQYEQKIILRSSRTNQTVISNRKILESAIYSLIDNAIKYSEPKSSIIVRPSRGRRAGFARLTIRDKTTGVRKSDIDRISQMLGKTTSPNPAHGGSSGLGLFATGKLIESIGGYVGMKTVPGGSSFYIELPIANQLNLQLR